LIGVIALTRKDAIHPLISHCPQLEAHLPAVRWRGADGRVLLAVTRFVQPVL
jgi:hypothetical protein